MTTNEDLKKAILEVFPGPPPVWFLQSLWGILVNADVFIPGFDKPYGGSFRAIGRLLEEIDNDDSTDYLTYYCSSSYNHNEHSDSQNNIYNELIRHGWSFKFFGGNV